MKKTTVKTALLEKSQAVQRAPRLIPVIHLHPRLLILDFSYIAVLLIADARIDNGEALCTVFAVDDDDLPTGRNDMLSNLDVK